MMAMACKAVTLCTTVVLVCAACWVKKFLAACKDVVWWTNCCFGLHSWLTKMFAVKRVRWRHVKMWLDIQLLFWSAKLANQGWHVKMWLDIQLLFCCCFVLQIWPTKVFAVQRVQVMMACEAVTWCSTVVLVCTAGRPRCLQWRVWWRSWQLVKMEKDSMIWSEPRNSNRIQTTKVSTDSL